MKTGRLNILFWLLFALIVSCEKKAAQINDPVIKQTSLKLNFNQNVFTTDPNTASTSAEVFIRNACFEPITTKTDQIPNKQLFKKYTWDANSNTLKFYIDKDIKFHNGAVLSSKHFRALFKQLLTEQSAQPNINSFFSTVKGWPLTVWLKENRNMADSLPAGFYFTNENSFTIRFNKNAGDGLGLLHGLDLYVSMKSNGNFYGTGPFKLKSRNSDIFYELERNNDNPNYLANFNAIQIRFIKNPNTELNDFLNGSLDLLFFNPYLEDKSTRYGKLKSILDDKYSTYTTTVTNIAKIRYLIIDQLENPSDIVLVLKKCGVSSDLWMMDAKPGIEPTFVKFLDFKNTIANADSIGFDADTVQDQSTLAIPTAKLIELKTDTIKDSNLKLSEIVLNEKQIDFYQANGPKKLLRDLVRELGEKEGLVIIVDAEPTYWISNKTLVGLHKYQDISLYIDDLYFENTPTY